MEDGTNKRLEKDEYCDSVMEQFPLLSDDFSENGAVTCDPTDKLIITIMNKYEQSIN